MSSFLASKNNRKRLKSWENQTVLKKLRYGHVQKKVALRDIAKTEKSQIFVLFENEASYEDFFCPQVF